MNTIVYSKDKIVKSLDGMDLIKDIEIGFVEYSRGNTIVPPVGELLFSNPPGDVHIKYGSYSHPEYGGAGYPEGYQFSGHTIYFAKFSIANKRSKLKTSK